MKRALQSTYHASGLLQFVLPNTNDTPAIELQFFANKPVSLLVSCELREPEIPIALGDRAVQRATMPKAAIDKNGDF